jgi:Ca2+-binding RTX toxin-like protein
MDGGLGSDSFIVDDPNDVIIERFNEGTDAVNASVTYTLAANLERLVLTGHNGIDGSGNALSNKLTGNSGDNHLYGMAGNDTLDGGAGLDVLEGGLGNDTYIIDGMFDVIVEHAGEGTDTVTANVSYALDANIETLILTGSAELTGMGNALNNALNGNGASNTLYGFEGNDTLDGKAGADLLIGGTGNDTYVVDSLLDAVVEYAGEGTDTVKASFSYVLSDPHLENLALTGTIAANGTGNSAANALTGNAAANHLYGLDGNDKLNGGAGADVLVGGSGNDGYTVDNVGDSVTENANEGTDSVSSSISYILGANLEKLALSGSADLDGTGNDLGNVLSGNSGANDLYGLAGKDTLSGGLGDDWLAGGLGGDTLTGGAGKDMFVFDVPETSANRDTIKDFEHGIDEILISSSAFSAFTGSVADALSANAFVVGIAATTAAHHIVYNNATGALYYDPDGVGGQSHIQMALLSTKPILDAADFLLI